MRKMILQYMIFVPGGDAASIAEDLELDARSVQDMLHSMDDDGDLIMSGGWYRLSEASRKRMGVAV